MPSGTSSDTIIKDVAATVENQLFPALTSLLERYGQLGVQQQAAEGPGAQQSQTWAQPAFQVKAACDELVQMLNRAQNTDQIGQIRLPRQVQQQPGGEQYSSE